MRAVQLAQKLWELPWMRNQSAPQSSQYLSSTRIGMSPFEGRAKQESPASDPGFKQTPGGLDAGLAWVATTCWGYLVVGTGLRARGYVVSVAPTGLGYFFASDPTARAVGARFARIPG